MLNRRVTSLVIGAVGLGVVGGVAFTSVALPKAVLLAPPAPVIATLNLEELVKNLDERTSREGELKAYSDGMQDELNKIVKDINDQQAKLAALDGAEKKTATAKLLELQANARAKKEIFEAMIDNRRAEIFRGLYEKINDASKRLADKNKYTMVVAADDQVRISPTGASNDVERQISLRRFVWVDKAHDITPELITMMNNEFKNGGSAAAAMPAGKGK